MYEVRQNKEQVSLRIDAGGTRQRAVFKDNRHQNLLIFKWYI
ncbi:hypothetical protein Bache_1311 [Bacteroides helcogenes P 36-108]|uniref:Uncharacterized protein n=1 Tax=Bacteroides helcogenes (strain ATCC 35417 / DSM 20613 / JCM 6297 / CCUG 15421 / P 36-108) TaxID=693979 RepID=E6SU17_BACT6|nr:hypothetical protein Bache_1311 [Bacteroides helcogenes P 36-108]